HGDSARVETEAGVPVVDLTPKLRDESAVRLDKLPSYVEAGRPKRAAAGGRARARRRGAGGGPPHRPPHGGGGGGRRPPPPRRPAYASLRCTVGYDVALTRGRSAKRTRASR